jgi:hypothetical protein
MRFFFLKQYIAIIQYNSLITVHGWLDWSFEKPSWGSTPESPQSLIFKHSSLPFVYGEVLLVKSLIIT